jgi:hypothetical protein
MSDRLTDADLDALDDTFDMSKWPQPVEGTWGMGKHTTELIRAALAELREWRVVYGPWGPDRTLGRKLL